MMRRILSRLGSRKSLLTMGVLVLVGGGLFATVGRGSVPDVPTADVTRSPPRGDEPQLACSSRRSRAGIGALMPGSGWVTWSTFVW